MEGIGTKKGDDKWGIFNCSKTLGTVWKGVPKKNPSYVAYEGFLVLIAPSPGLEPGTP